MQTVLDLFNQVEATSSKNEKGAILKRELPLSMLAQRVAQYALDQGKSYNLTALPDVVTTDAPDDAQAIFAYLDFLSDKRGCTYVEARALAGLCHSAAARDLVTRILCKDLNIGAKANTFNKAMPNLIYTVPYNRYSSFASIKMDKLEGANLLVQQKNDGFFSYLQDPEIVQGNPFCTRQGNTFNLRGHVESDFHLLRRLQDKLKEPIRTKGELLVVRPDGKGYLTRAVGNGLIEKYYLGADMPEFGKSIRYIIWGYVTDSEWAARESQVVYSQIWSNLQAIPFDRDGTSSISLTRSQPVDSFDKAMAFYRRMREQGLEGAMLKVIDQLKWKHNTSGNANGFKMKAEAEAEFEIVDAYFGDPKGKWKDHLGGLVVKSSCGKILTNIGGGFTDDERLLGVVWWKQNKGKIITGKFTDIVKDKTERTTYCLEHSRLPNTGGALVETRFSEKDEADTLEYCIAQLKAA